MNQDHERQNKKLILEFAEISAREAHDRATQADKERLAEISYLLSMEGKEILRLASEMVHKSYE